MVFKMPLQLYPMPEGYIWKVFYGKITIVVSLQEVGSCGIKVFWIQHYSRYLLGEEQELAGVQVSMEEPKEPDLVLYNDGEKTPEGQVGVIMEFIEAKGKALESRQEK